MKTLYLDIETSPLITYSWGLRKQYHHDEHMIEPSRVLGVALKWEGSQSVHWYGEDRYPHEKMIELVHRHMDQADTLVWYNGDRFDELELNREFIQLGLNPPAPYKKVDLFKVAKKTLRLPSYKLGYVCQALGLDTKVQHSGFDMWVRCLQKDPAAWREMARYARQDVRILEPLKQRLLPWSSSFPHQGLYVDTEHPMCPRCGSERLQRRGFAAAKNYTYPRFQCQDCGGWSKGSKRERVTEGSPL